MKLSSRTYAAALLPELKEKRTVSGAAVRRFVEVLRRNGDMAKLPAILKECEALYCRANGITKVDMIIAREQERISAEKMKRTFGPKSAVSVSVKPEIIGGAIFIINDEWIVDGSIRRRLEQMFK